MADQNDVFEALQETLVVLAQKVRESSSSEERATNAEALANVAYTYRKFAGN